MKLFTDGSSNAKIAKSENSGLGYSTMILHLAPAKLSGREVCPGRSAGCTAACLNTAGMGKFTTTQQARIKRTKMWFDSPNEFKTQIKKELNSFVKRCDKKQKLPAIRMNGTSDIVWEKKWPKLFTDYPDIQFYDYTKLAFRCMARYQRKMPPNYHLTFSRSESNQNDVRRVIRSGVTNVVAVFNSKNFPKTYLGKRTYSADETDLRFLDPVGQVGCLYVKGDGKKDKTGFVLPVVS